METGEPLEDWTDLAREEADSKWSRLDPSRGSDGRRRQEALTLDEHWKASAAAAGRERAWPPDTNRELTMSSRSSRRRADAGEW
jgi:hypothetical protein